MEFAAELRELERDYDISLSFDEPLDLDGLIDTMMPQPGDFTTTDYVDWCQNGLHVLRVFDGDWTEALRKTMDRNGSWPNAWHLSPRRQPIILDIWD